MHRRKHDHTTAAFVAPLVGFKSRKAAQICAFFAVKAGGTIDKLKVIKLVYFAERQFLADNHMPMLFDEFYSLPNGPICSSTLNGLDGLLHPSIWDEFIARHGRDKIIASKKFGRDDLDEISDAEMGALEKCWTEFGHLSAWSIRNYSHDHCPEYSHVDEGRRAPITYRAILQAMGAGEIAEDVDREVDAMRRLESALGG